jgi:hypothetical protein
LLLTQVVIAGTSPAIEGFLICLAFKDVDARHKAGHDAQITDGPWPLSSLRWHFLEFDLAAQVGSHLLERCDEVVADPRAPGRAKCPPPLAAQAQAGRVGPRRRTRAFRRSHGSRSPLSAVRTLRHHRVTKMATVMPTAQIRPRAQNA